MKNNGNLIDKLKEVDSILDSEGPVTEDKVERLLELIIEERTERLLELNNKKKEMKKPVNNDEFDEYVKEATRFAQSLLTKDKITEEDIDKLKEHDYTIMEYAKKYFVKVDVKIMKLDFILKKLFSTRGR